MTEPSDEGKYTTKELEEKFAVKIKFFDPNEAPLSLSMTAAYYDWAEDTIYLTRYLSGKARLSTLAHEIGHKRHADELRRTQGPILYDEESKLEHECEAWERGLPVAKELGVIETYRKDWRTFFPPMSCVVCECPFPGDDKVPHASIGKGQEYSFEEWGNLMKRYIRTGKWAGKRSTTQFGGREHVG